MRRILAIVPFAGILAACAEPASTREVTPTRAIDFRPGQIRQPIVFTQLRLDGEYSAEEKRAMPEELEGALLEELNTHAVLAKEVSVSVGAAKRDPGPALARARALDADHAIVVDVRVWRGVHVFCPDTRRRFQATATRWDQSGEVVRASDGAVRYRITPGSMTPVFDLEADCDNQQGSRRTTTTQAFAESVKRLVTRLLAS